MKHVFFMILTIALLSSCAKDGTTGPQGPAGPAGPVTTLPVVSDVDADIANLTADENNYRLGLGQTALTSGLSCSLQQVASGQWISSSSPSYTSGLISVTGTNYTYLYKGNFNQPDASTGASNLIPSPLQSYFVGKNYKISCSGYVVVTETGYYEFDMTSDDGSILTVDNTQVINNDGNHGMVQKFGTKFLRRGVRIFSIQYAQTGGGNFGLILKANGVAIDPKVYLH